jgi:hypothetical protein
MAMGVLDADRMPALPVVVKAMRAAMVMMTSPTGPEKALAARESGVREPLITLAGSVPTVVKTAKT